MKIKTSILGSTGSIGSTTLNIIDKKPNIFSINLLSAKKNMRLIVKQIKKYKPKIFNKFEKKNLLATDLTISSIPGIEGLEPTLLMTPKSKKILIANKESIICGWSLIKDSAKKNNTKIIPIDSEHFSIFKLLENHSIKEINKVFLTASGGPFLHFKPRQLKSITPANALKHPKWKMGKKITIDSSTLMNKMLEIVEAQKLFDIPLSKLDVIIHPNSLVHAIIELKNGLYKFIYHETSMIIPISNAIFEKNLDIQDFFKKKKKANEPFIESLQFLKVNTKIFPIYKLKKRFNEYYSTPIIINAANELLIDLFLKKKINYLAISRTIMKIMKDRNYRKYAIRKASNLHEIKLIDKWAKKTIMEKLNGYV